MTFDPASCPKRAFESCVKKVEARVSGRQYAVEGVTFDADDKSMTCKWKKGVGYKSVYSWFESALGDNDLTFRIHCLSPQASDPVAATSPAAASKVSAAQVDVGPAAASGSAAASAAGEPLPANIAKRPRSEPRTLAEPSAKAKVVAAPLLEQAASPLNTLLPLVRADAPLSLAWLPVKAFELDRGAEVDPVTSRSYVNIRKLGEGAFGTTYRMVDATAGTRVVKKQLRTSGSEASWEFFHEVALLARLAHDNVVRLIDVEVRPFTLVFEDAGNDLEVHVKATGPLQEGPAADIVRQMAEGLAYLHAQAVIHGDVKPSNVAVDGREQVRILDLGCAIIALPGYRSCRPRADVQQHGLRYCTLSYRAPEVLLGDTGFSFPLDAWSCGCVWVYLRKAGHIFAAPAAILVVFEVFSRVGSPTGEELAYFQQLPLWSSQMPQFERPPFENIFAAPASPRTVELLKGLFTLSPWKRLSMQAARHAFVAASVEACPPSVGVPAALEATFSRAPETGAVLSATPLEVAPPTALPPSSVASAAARPAALDDVPTPCAASTPFSAAPGPASMELVAGTDGTTAWQGERAPFSLLAGNVGPAVLGWLRDGFSEEAEWSFEPSADAKDRKTENGNKLEIAFHLLATNKKVPLKLNALTASSPANSRWRAWILAFKAKNAGNFGVMQDRIRAAVESLAHPGANGTAFLEENIEDWALSLGALQVLRPTEREDPRHFDGGASFVHLGLTLHGTRCLHLKVGDPLDTVSVPCRPGHVYVGNLAAAEHWVQHPAPAPDTECMATEALGLVQLVLLARSRTFRNSFGGTQSSGPNPRVTFKAVAEAQIEAFREGEWRLPSLDECVCRQLELDL